MDMGGVIGNLTRLHFAIMGILSENSLTMSELAKRLMMTKPQMTHLVDQLVKMGNVERHPDANDRRVINLALTEEGRRFLLDMYQKVKKHIRVKFAGLSEDDLAAMADALDTLRGIADKL